MSAMLCRTLSQTDHIFPDAVSASSAVSMRTAFCVLYQKGSIDLATVSPQLYYLLAGRCKKFTELQEAAGA